jgi:glycine hydroxymethyltransferase
MGYNVLTGGTDNHLMLVNVSSPRADASHHLTGFVAQKCLEDCGIVVDRMRLPYDDKPDVASGIRLGTPIVTKNGMGTAEMDQISAMFDSILRRVQMTGDSDYSIPESFRKQIAAQARDLASKFPLH